MRNEPDIGADAAKAADLIPIAPGSMSKTEEIARPSPHAVTDPTIDHQPDQSGGYFS